MVSMIHSLIISDLLSPDHSYLEFHLLNQLPIRRIDCRCHVHGQHFGDFYKTLNLREEGDLVDSNLYRSFGNFLFE